MMKSKLYNILKQKKRWIILFITLILFFIILQSIFFDKIIKFDTNTYNVIAKVISPGITTFLKIITNLGGATGIISVTIALLITIRSKYYKVCIIINLIIITLINQILKFIIQRPRPEEFRIIEESGYSFPSGHSMVSMAFYGFLIYIAYKEIKNTYIRNIVFIMLAILILFIGLSRIYLGVHYASDVLAGFLLSISYLAIYTKVIENYK